MTALRRPPGLSLPSLLLLLAIIAGVSTVAIPAWFSRPAITLDAAARLLVQDLEEAQQSAAFLFRSVLVEFDEDGDGYSVLEADGSPLPAPVGGGPFVRSYDRDAVFDGVRIESAAFGAGRRLRVLGTGAYESSGEVTLSYRGASRTVRVDAAEHRVALVRE